jgi:hypothetical protein
MSDPQEPLSWLLLERYALGELPASERARVEAQLAVSESDRARLAELRQAATALPDLPAAPRPPARRARWLGMSLGLAAAAALLLMMRPQALEHGVMGPAVKGNDISIEILSDRKAGPARTFSPGERFKLLVSCPPGFPHELRPLVLQGDARFEALPRMPVFACGNRIPWPGAFALDGSEEVRVCVLWSDAALGAPDPATSESAVCRVLVPAP